MPMPTEAEQQQYEEAKRPQLERMTKKELIQLLFETERHELRSRLRHNELHNETIKVWSDRVDQITKRQDQEIARLNRELELVSARGEAFSSGQNSALETVIETVLAKLVGSNHPSGAGLRLGDVIRQVIDEYEEDTAGFSGR